MDTKPLKELDYGAVTDIANKLSSVLDGYPLREGTYAVGVIVASLVCMADDDQTIINDITQTIIHSIANADVLKVSGVLKEPGWNH